MAKKKTETAAAPAPPPPPSPSELTAFTTEPEADKPFAVPGKPRILANAMERSMFWFYGPNGIDRKSVV